MHWVPQSVLFLEKGGGGQGLVHIPSIVATFRFQFTQRYLTGPTQVVWRDLTSFILRKAAGLGIDTALFLMDFNLVKLRGLSPFYQSLFSGMELF